MHFPSADKLALPVHFERYVPGRLHPDGRRYLPQLIMRAPDGVLLGVVDRHHYVDDKLAGNDGVARLVFLLGTISLQQPGEERLGIDAPVAGHVETAPRVYGRVLEVPSWELRRGDLPYEALFVELLLDIGPGVVGVRTNMTANSVAAQLGTQQIEPGDPIAVHRSRIDILGFEPKHATSGEQRAAGGERL